MEVVGSALGDHLHLTPGARIEVGSLVVGGYPKLFDAFDGGGDDAGRVAAVEVRVRSAREGVVAVVAVLVGRDIAAIDGENVLIIGFTGHFAARGDTRLEGYEGVGITAEVGKGHQGGPEDGGAGRRRGGLKFGSRGCFDVDGGGGGTDFESDVEGGGAADKHLLSWQASLLETLHADRKVVGSGGDVQEDIATRFVGGDGLGAARGGVFQRHDGVFDRGG